jgi:hypothetical protein
MQFPVECAKVGANGGGEVEGLPPEDPQSGAVAPQPITRSWVTDVFEGVRRGEAAGGWSCLPGLRVKWFCCDQWVGGNSDEWQGESHLSRYSEHEIGGA